MKQHTDSPWGWWSLERGRTAPVQRPDGPLVAREKGPPHGGVASPRLANRCVPDTVEGWRRRPQPESPCEREAEDAVRHGRSEAQAPRLRQARAPRVAEGRRAWPPPQPKSVSCKADDRRGASPHDRCEVLGSTFRPRRSKHRRGKDVVNVSPAARAEATRDCRRERRRWHRHTRRDTSLEALSRRCNPVLRGGARRPPVGPVGPLSDVPACGPEPGPRGAAAVHASAGPPAPSGPGAATAGSSPAGAVRARASLAGGGWTRRAGGAERCTSGAVRARG